MHLISSSVIILFQNLNIQVANSELYCHTISHLSRGRKNDVTDIQRTKKQINQVQSPH